MDLEVGVYDSDYFAPNNQRQSVGKMNMYKFKI